MGGGRKVVALLLALALTGSVLALEQKRLYRDEGGLPFARGGQPPEANGVLTIEQHVVFVEVIAEGQKLEDVVGFAAVVGLVKRCQTVDRVFDNAVLWFNDQFVFGGKDNSQGPENTTEGPVFGENPARVHAEADVKDTQHDGFIRARDLQERWGGCWIPEGFIHVTRGRNGVQQAMVDDNNCKGCLFDYIGSFYVTDPNDHQWLIDLYEGTSGTFAGDPLYTVHLQADPSNPFRQGFPDRAPWTYREDGRIRPGMPYSEDPNSQTYNLCHDNAELDGSPRFASDGWSPSGPIQASDTTAECSAEYNFLSAVAFDHTRIGGNLGNPWGGVANEHTKIHGNGGSSDGDKAWAGNSHPHNKEECYRPGGTAGDPCDSGPRELHSSIHVDIHFARRAPFFTEQHPYWDGHGAPPLVNSDCSAATSGTPIQGAAIAARTFPVCDPVADEGFHLHDGSQTISP